MQAGRWRYERIVRLVLYVLACAVACVQQVALQGIHVEGMCYFARQDGLKTHFEVPRMTAAPRATDGKLWVTVTDEGGGFASFEVEVPVVLNEFPRSVAFDIEVPESARASTPFVLRFRANSGQDTYSGRISSPCH